MQETMSFKLKFTVGQYQTLTLLLNSFICFWSEGWQVVYKVNYGILNTFTLNIQWKQYSQMFDHNQVLRLSLCKCDDFVHMKATLDE